MIPFLLSFLGTYTYIPFLSFFFILTYYTFSFFYFFFFISFVVSGPFLEAVHFFAELDISLQWLAVCIFLRCSGCILLYSR